MNQELGRPARMSEAEVSLRLAFWLVRKKYVSNDVSEVIIAIRGAQDEVGGAGAFDVAGFLHENHWLKSDSAPD